MNNQYYIIRHGHSWRNKKNIASCWPETILYPLTGKGKKQASEAAKKLKKKKIDLIFTSDLLRTKQTAGIIGKAIGVRIKPDKRLREINVGIFNNQQTDEIGRFWDKERKFSPFKYYQRRFKLTPPKGESYVDAEKRLADFIKEMEKRYEDKNILIVSHQRPLTLLEKVAYNYGLRKFVKVIIENKEIKTGEIRKLSCKKYGF